MHPCLQGRMVLSLPAKATLMPFLSDNEKENAKYYSILRLHWGSGKENGKSL